MNRTDKIFDRVEIGSADFYDIIEHLEENGICYIQNYETDELYIIESKNTNDDAKKEKNIVVDWMNDLIDICNSANQVKFNGDSMNVDTTGMNELIIKIITYCEAVKTTVGG